MMKNKPTDTNNARIVGRAKLQAAPTSELIEKLKASNFTDEHGHKLERCAAFIEIVGRVEELENKIFEMEESFEESEVLESSRIALQAISKLLVRYEKRNAELEKENGYLR